MSWKLVALALVPVVLSVCLGVGAHLVSLVWDDAAGLLFLSVGYVVLNAVSLVYVVRSIRRKATPR